MFEKIYEVFKKEKAVAVIRTNTYDKADKISNSAIKGGMKIIEVTMSVPDAPKLIGKLKKEYKDIYVGAGTVLTKENLLKCIESNADFIVSPCMDEELIKCSREKNILLIPGLMTMSELNKVYGLGLRFVKVFPGNVVGKSFIGAAKSIFKDISVMPTGGVNKDNAKEWLNAGADCVGIGSDLNKTYISSGSDGVIEYCKLLISNL